jgi:hypothetical protein
MKLTLITFFFILSTVAQESVKNIDLIRQLVKETRNNVPDLSNYTNEQEKLIVDAHKKKIELQLEFLTYENVITEGPLYNYVSNLLERIKNSNPQIPSDLALVISKSIDYNAYTFGNNLLYMNLGLLLELNNDDEIAVVIGHEIGHVIYQHSTSAIIDWAVAKTDKETLAKLKAARRSDYRYVSAVNEILTPRLFESKEKSRKNELQADSIGFQLIKNAGFDVNNAIHEFLIMHEHDLNTSTPLDFSLLPKIFQTKMNETLSIYNRYGSLGQVEKDNKFEPYLRSHPYSDERLIKLLNDNNLNPPNPPEKFVLPPDYAAIKSELIDSTITAAAHAKNYSWAIYFAIRYQDYFRSKTEFDATMLAFFQSLSYLKERRVAGKFISLQDPQQKEDFDQLTHFLSQLTPKDCDEIADAFEAEMKTESFNSEAWIIAQLIEYTRNENFENCEILYNTWYEKIRIGPYREVYGELDHYWRNVKRLKFVKTKK